MYVIPPYKDTTCTLYSIAGTVRSCINALRNTVRHAPVQGTSCSSIVGILGNILCGFRFKL